MIRESYEPVSSKTEAGGIRREEEKGDDVNVVIVTVEGVTNDGDIIASKVEVVTDDPATVTDDPATDDIVEYYRKRFPLTTEAMGL